MGGPSFGTAEGQFVSDTDALAKIAAARTRHAFSARKSLPVRKWRTLPKGGAVSHLVIPDTQTKPEAPIDHLAWIGRYIMDRRPNVIVHLGDHWDMPSCSTHDDAVIHAREKRRVADDLTVGKEAMRLLLAPLRKWNAGRRRGKQYQPRRVFLMANHEDRLRRKIDADPTLEGSWGDDPFELVENGWEVQPYLAPIVIDGIAYSHFFPRSANGRITQNKRGAPNALNMIKREMRSCTAGHLQGLDVAVYHAGGGRTFWGLISGSCYLHEEEYLTPEGNQHWHGVVVKHDVHDGQYDPMFVSLDYLRRTYG